MFILKSVYVLIKQGHAKSLIIQKTSKIRILPSLYVRSADVTG